MRAGRPGGREAGSDDLQSNLGSQVPPRQTSCHPPQGRTDRGAKKQRLRGSGSRAQAKSAREPWVLVASPALAHLSARRVVDLYRRRMQIEEGVRDLKSPRHGAALRHSMTRVPDRMDVLILLHALASVATRLRGQVACRDRENLRLLAHNQAVHRPSRALSVWRIGWEIHKRGWPPSSRGGLGTNPLLAGPATVVPM